MAAADYCNDQTLWGKGMFITLKDIVDEYMDGLTPDNHTYDVDRRLVVKQARNAIKKFNFTSVKAYKSLEFELKTSLQVVLPIDYVDYYKISWIDENGLSYPMTKNDRLAVSLAAIQDENGDFACDEDGNFTTAAGTSQDIYSEQAVVSSSFNLDRSQVYENGYFNIDKDAGVIKFGSDAKEKRILLEYITDGYSGLSDDKIKINKLAGDAINEQIYFKLIERNAEVIQSEKARARKARNIAVRVMEKLINPVREEDIYQIVRARSRWNKQS